MDGELVQKSQIYFDLLKTEADFQKFIELNSTSIRWLNKAIRKEKAAGTLGRRLQLEHRLCTLKGLSAKAKHRRSTASSSATRSGRGSVRQERRSSRVMWVELENAFQCR